MEFSVFREHVLKEIESILKETATVSLYNTQKNNGVSLWAVVIKGNDTNVAPTIYLEKYYEMYNTTLTDIREIAIKIIDFYYDHCDDVSFDFNNYLDFEKIKALLRCKLVNTEKNRELLEKVPHKEFLDLSIVFYCLFDENIEYTQITIVYKQHLKFWDVEEDELFEIAFKNTYICDLFEVSPMHEVIGQMIDNMRNDNGISYEDDSVLEEIYENDMQMYVISNKRKVFGATAMLYIDLFKKIATKIDSDLYILPSSIHEIIVVPMHTIDDLDNYGEMVRCVNENEVYPDEVLSDNVYIYYRCDNKICLPK